MTRTSKQEYVRTIRLRYAQASRRTKQQILTEVCATTGYHRKYAIQLLKSAATPAQPRRRRRAPAYGAPTLAVLRAIWEAAGYPWSARLKALLPLWLPWAKRRLPIPPLVERQLLAISPSTIDRRSRARNGRCAIASTGARSPARS